MYLSYTFTSQVISARFLFCLAAYFSKNMKGLIPCQTTKMKRKKIMSGFQIRKMTVTAILAAVSTVLMFLSFNVPFMPSFIKMDFSELPALIAAFAYGPLSGVIVCLIKKDRKSVV